MRLMFFEGLAKMLCVCALTAFKLLNSFLLIYVSKNFLFDSMKVRINSYTVECLLNQGQPSMSIFRA